MRSQKPDTVPDCLRSAPDDDMDTIQLAAAGERVCANHVAKAYWRIVEATKRPPYAWHEISETERNEIYAKRQRLLVAYEHFTTTQKARVKAMGPIYFDSGHRARTRQLSAVR